MFRQGPNPVTCPACRLIAFRLQLAEGRVNRSAIRTGIVEAITGKAGTFTDAHTGMAQQQEDVGGQIVAAEQFLLD